MKSNTKKRLIAFMLCMVLVLSSAISAFADDLDTQAQDQTTTMAESETQASVADEPVATSMDDSTNEQQPVAEAEENQEQAVETQDEQQPKENASEGTTSEDNSAIAEQEAIEKESDVSIQTTVNGTTITMSGPHSSFPEGTTYEISASELNENETKDVEIALKKKEDENDIKIATYKAYDIKLLVDGVESQPTGDVNVKFEGGEVAENITDSENVGVYHVDEGEQVANDVTETSTNDTVTMTTNHFSTYVITTTKDNGVDITVQHYLQNPKTQLYRDSKVHLAKGQKIEDLSSPMNYRAEKVVKINENGDEGDELKGTDQLITEKQTYRVYYTATTGNSNESVQMFDYQVKGDNNVSINDADNYSSSSSDTTRFASGLANNQYSGNGYNTTINVNGSTVYINTWDQKSGDGEVNHVNGKVFGNGNAATGIIKGVNFDTGALIMEKNSSNQQMYEPGFFTTEQKPGKQILSGYKLNFNRNGDTYTLTGVNKPDGTPALSNYDSNKGSDFFPLDSIRDLHKDNANNPWDHNCFFGMRYDIEFTIGDYLGDLNYSFTGDDDLWAILDAKKDGGQVVIDLGGIHSALSKEVDLWKILLKNDNYTEQDKKEYADKDTVHTLTILYMERGAYESNCKMNFTLPNSKVINSVEAPKSLTFTKTSTSGTTLPGATFTLYNSDGTTVKDTATSNSNGNVQFDNLYSGTYIIKETAAPSGYIASKDTWTVEVGSSSSNVKMYKTGDNSKTPVTTIQNSTEKEEATKNLTNGKSAEVIDESSRIFQINLNAETTGRSEGTAAQKASVVLVLDSSNSLGSNGLATVKASAQSFISTLQANSPESEVSIIWFNGDEGSSNSTKVQDYCTLTQEGVATLNSFITNRKEVSGGTPMGDALSQAYTKIKSAHNQNKYVLLFTDGMPGHYDESGKRQNTDGQYFNCMVANKACNYADKIKAQNDGNAILYTIGYFKDRRSTEDSQIYWHRGDSDSTTDGKSGHGYKKTNLWNYTNNHDTLTTDTAFLSDYIATKASGDNTYAFTTGNASNLADIFKKLAAKIGDLYSISPAKIVDTIDARFKLTEESRIALVGDVEGVKNTETNTTTYTKADGTIVITENADGTTTIKWTGDAAKIGNAQDTENSGWKTSFNIQAKDDFIGGNEVPTNGADSGIYVDDEITNTKPFPQPSVNVKLLTPAINSKEITFYKGETITSDKFANELLKAYKIMELDSKTSLKLGDAGIPELTDEDIASLRSGTKITKDYSYPNTNNDVVGQFEFEFVPDATGMNGDHLADVTGNKVETYTLSIKFVAKTLEERTAILNQAGKTIVPPQTDSKEINDSKLNKINVPKGGNIVTDTSVTGNYIVNVFAIYKQSTSTNPDTKEHPKLAGAKFSLTGKKHKMVFRQRL